MNDLVPQCCLLCNQTLLPVKPARFQQIYRQYNAPSLLLSWWECAVCRGVFVSPVPTVEQISSYWQLVTYMMSDHATQIAAGKAHIWQNVLTELKRVADTGHLLDFGCNYGNFLVEARHAGWHADGFEPAREIAHHTEQLGFQVYSDWTMEAAGVASAHYDALTAMDVFYYTWNPYETLCSFYQVLKPGGLLAMRLSNKRQVLEIIRRFTPEGAQRNQQVTKVLQAQFHSISLSALTKILEQIGFREIKIIARAEAYPLSESAPRTRWAYCAADIFYRLSLKQVNLYPGSLLFGRKRQ